MWDLPESGVEPVSPVLAGGFFTTLPPGKHLMVFESEKRAGKFCRAVGNLKAGTLMEKVVRL